MYSLCSTLPTFIFLFILPVMLPTHSLPEMHPIIPSMYSKSNDTTNHLNTSPLMYMSQYFESGVTFDTLP